MSDTKKCSKCGEVKGLGEFYKKTASKDGKDTACIDCRVKAKADWRKRNPHAAKRQQLKAREWRLANPDREKQRRDAYHEKNKQVRNAISRQWKEQNHAAHLAYLADMREQLADSYVATALGMRLQEAPPELIALKREQLAIKRMARELKKAATKATGENE